ncbi:hypothetical protein FQR65_LT08340 [Abscondita terminalis]|nr:hypothetical protein FQR65_LT08340 [Abscondita terminalis]
MGAVVNGNETTHKPNKRKFPPTKPRKFLPNRAFNGNHPPSLLMMRPRLPLPHLPPPRMGPPAPGMRLPPPFRGGPQLRPPLLPPNILRSLRPQGSPRPVMRPPLPPPLGLLPPPGMNMRSHMRLPMPPLIMRPPRNFKPSMNNKRHINQGKIIKRKRSAETDLNKPWVTEQVKVEFAKKDALLKTAKSTFQSSDWATYRSQRDRCNKIYAAAKLEYIGQHPEEVRIPQLMSQPSNVPILTEPIDYTADVVFSSEEEEEHIDYDKTICEMCDREFQSNFQYRKHVSEHRVCGIDDCTFTAHEKIVEKHIEMQHCTGLYDKIKNVNTPEDIAKWIADRKSKYPTKQNVEKRYEQQKEMLERGERLKRKPHKFDRKNKTRASLSDRPLIKKKNQAKRRKVTTPNVSLIQEQSDWNGTLCPFRGTGQLYDEDVVEKTEEFDDAEWDQNVKPVENVPTCLNNALGSLMSAYNSESDEDEGPTEEKISRTCEVAVGDEPRPECVTRGDLKTKRKRKRVCRKKTSNAKTENEAAYNAPIPIYRKRKVTLLERLLANEIVHERNLLLQCVRYVVSNNFFEKTDV